MPNRLRKSDRSAGVPPAVERASRPRPPQLQEGQALKAHLIAVHYGMPKGRALIQCVRARCLKTAGGTPALQSFFRKL
jgi:hypothetical protein